MVKIVYYVIVTGLVWPVLFGMKEVLQLKINNRPYEIDGNLDRYKKLCCVECPRVLASSDDIVTYWDRSYHRQCWRLAHANFWGSKRYWEKDGNAVEGYDNLWRLNSTFYLLTLPLALSIRFENKEIALFTAALIFGTTIWAEWLLYKANSFKNYIPMKKIIETYPPHQAVKYACEHSDKIIHHFFVSSFFVKESKLKFIDDACACVECGDLLEQGQELRTLHIANNQDDQESLKPTYIWAQSGVWHEDCFEKHWEYSLQHKLTNDFMAISWAYIKTRINDTFTWWVPTPLHALNYVAGSYLVYKAYKGQIPKEQMDKIWELIFPRR